MTDQYYDQLSHRIQNQIPELLALLESSKNIINSSLIAENPLNPLNMPKIQVENVNPSMEDQPPTMVEIEDFFKAIEKIGQKVKVKSKRVKMPPPQVIPSTIIKSKSKQSMGIISRSLSTTNINDTTIINATVAELTTISNNESISEINEQNRYVPRVTVEMIKKFEESTFEPKDVRQTLETDRLMFSKLNKNIEKIQTFLDNMQQIIDKKQVLMNSEVDVGIQQELCDRLELLFELLELINLLEENKNMYSMEELKEYSFPLYDCIDDLLQFVQNSDFCMTMNYRSV